MMLFVCVCRPAMCRCPRKSGKWQTGVWGGPALWTSMGRSHCITEWQERSSSGPLSQGRQPLCGGSLPSSPIPLVTRLSVYEGGILVPWQFTMPTPKTHKIHVLLKYKTSHSILIAPPPIFTPVSDQSLKICLRWLSGTNTLSLILRPTQWKRTDFLKLSSDLHTGCLCTHAHPQIPVTNVKKSRIWRAGLVVKYTYQVQFLTPTSGGS